jgi:hypothetical protein
MTFPNGTDPWALIAKASVGLGGDPEHARRKART